MGKCVNWQKKSQIKLFIEYFKLNIDGSVQGNLGKASAGDLIRKCEGGASGMALS